MIIVVARGGPHGHQLPARFVGGQPEVADTGRGHLIYFRIRYLNQVNHGASIQGSFEWPCRVPEVSRYSDFRPTTNGVHGRVLGSGRHSPAVPAHLDGVGLLLVVVDKGAEAVAALLRVLGQVPAVDAVAGRQIRISVSAVEKFDVGEVHAGPVVEGHWDHDLDLGHEDRAGPFGDLDKELERVLTRGDHVAGGPRAGPHVQVDEADGPDVSRFGFNNNYVFEAAIAFVVPLHFVLPLKP